MKTEFHPVLSECMLVERELSLRAVVLTSVKCEDRTQSSPLAMRSHARPRPDPAAQGSASSLLCAARPITIDWWGWAAGAAPQLGCSALRPAQAPPMLALALMTPSGSTS